MKCMTYLILGIFLYIFPTTALGQLFEDQFRTAGGSGWNIAKDIHYSHITGSFEDTIYFGNTSLTSAGETDIFIAKYEFWGLNLLWAVRAGGEGSDSGEAIIVGSGSNIYVAGYFTGEASFGNFTLTSAGEKDIFVAKLDSNGNWLWVKRAGGSSNDYCNSIALDSSGNIIITGRFYETADFGDFELTSSGSADLYVAKLSPDGNWIWATRAGGEGYIESNGVASGYNGIFITGSFSMIAEFGDHIVSTDSWGDVFVAMLDHQGNWLWVNRGGGDFLDKGEDIYVLHSYRLFITGEFRGSAEFGETVLSSSSNSLPNMFVASLDSYGNWLWATQAESSPFSISNAKSITGPVNEHHFGPVVTGYFWQDVKFGDIELYGRGGYVAIADYNSGEWLLARKIGTTSSSNVFGYSVWGQTDIIHITGPFYGTTSFAGTTYQSSGLTDVFLARYWVGPSSIDEYEHPVPEEFTIKNYPNPFNPETTILFYLPISSDVTLEIFNNRGQKIATLLDEYRERGEHSLVWNGVDDRGVIQPSGVYFYRIKTGNHTTQGKMLLVK